MAQPQPAHAETGASPPQGGNFPPFDASTFVPQLFWLAVTFTVLYLALERLALPRIARVLGDRRTRIADDLNRAEKLRLEADAALKAYEKALAEARAHAAAIAQEARTAIKAESNRRIAEVEAELLRQIEAAEAAIATAKNEALAGVRAVAIEVAASIVEKVLHERPPAGALSSAVDSELKVA